MVSKNKLETKKKMKKTTQPTTAFGNRDRLVRLLTLKWLHKI
jgi:hypothetical protein